MDEDQGLSILRSEVSPLDLILWVGGGGVGERLEKRRYGHFQTSCLSSKKDY